MRVATVGIRRYDADTRIITVDCRHSTTVVAFHHAPDGEIDPTDGSLIALACLRGLEGTPCRCLNELLVEIGHAN